MLFDSTCYIVSNIRTVRHYMILFNKEAGSISKQAFFEL